MGDRALRELLAGLAERVEVRRARLGGRAAAALPSGPQGGAGDARAARGRHADRCALDDRERPFHCHHEKLVIVDGRVAFVGGIDLTTLGGDRLDSSPHPARGRLGWHDAASRLEGPAVGDVAAHFALRWQEVTGEALDPGPPPEPAGETRAPGRAHGSEQLYDRLPRGDFRILESYLRALRHAERLVYLESQFLWSPELVDVLAEKLRRPPSDDFRLVVVLPAHPNNGEEDTRGQLGVLAEADGGAGRFLACTLWQPGTAAKPVYVHAKIGIVDDRWLTIGSANLNEHSLFNDTEMNVVTHDPELARAVAPAALGGAPRLRAGGAGRRPGGDRRRALAAARRGAARAAEAGRADDPPPAPAPARLAAREGPARPAERLPGRRLGSYYMACRQPAGLVRRERPRPAVAADARPVRDPRLGGDAAADAGGPRRAALPRLARALAFGRVARSGAAPPT